MEDINFENMKLKALLLMDPDSGYTQEDFDAEFGHIGKTTITSNPDIFKINLEFVNKSTNQDPEYATDGASGFDLRANLEESITIPSGRVAIVPTGLFFNIPPNFEIQIRPRSGLAAKNSVTVLNSPGTIDADYRGEVKVILINHGLDEFTINHGDRIAQAVMASVFAKNVVNLSKVDEISNETERGTGGFGSTGVK
jgi:dUTP pyrophosphatase